MRSTPRLASSKRTPRASSAACPRRTSRRRRAHGTSPRSQSASSNDGAVRERSNPGGPIPQLYHVVLFETSDYRSLEVIVGEPALKSPFTAFVIVDSTLNEEVAEEVVRIWTKTEAIDYFQEIWDEVNDPAKKGARFSIMNSLVHEQQDLLKDVSRMQKLTIEHHFSQVKLGRANNKP